MTHGAYVRKVRSNSNESIEIIGWIGLNKRGNFENFCMMELGCIHSNSSTQARWIRADNFLAQLRDNIIALRRQDGLRRAQ